MTTPNEEIPTKKAEGSSSPKPTKPRTHTRQLRRLLDAFLEEQKIGPDATVEDLLEALDRELVQLALRG